MRRWDIAVRDSPTSQTMFKGVVEMDVGRVVQVQLDDDEVIEIIITPTQSNL